MENKIWILFENVAWEGNYILAVFDHQPSEEEQAPFTTNYFGSFSVEEYPVKTAK